MTGVQTCALPICFPVTIIIGAKSGVTSDIPKGSIVSGYPVREHHEDLKIKVAMGRVPDMVKKIKEIEKKLEGNK